MRFSVKVLVGSMLAVSALIIVFANRPVAIQAPAAGQSHTFYYYPKVNMYYDVTRSSYIVLADDGRTWEYAKQVSDRLSAGLGKKAVLVNPVLPVWKNNEHHRLVYSTSLYASAQDFRKDPPKPPVKPLVTKKAVAEKNAKKENGIERFFNRLFKKKSSTGGKTSKQG